MYAAMTGKAVSTAPAVGSPSPPRLSQSTIAGKKRSHCVDDAVCINFMTIEIRARPAGRTDPPRDRSRQRPDEGERVRCPSSTDTTGTPSSSA
jgi:hypothetical protein